MEKKDKGNSAKVDRDQDEEMEIVEEEEEDEARASWKLSASSNRLTMCVRHSCDTEHKLLAEKIGLSNGHLVESIKFGFVSMVPMRKG